MDYYIPRFFHHGTIDILAMPAMDKTSLLLARLADSLLGGGVECCSLLCRMISCIPGLLTQDASSSFPVVKIRNIYFHSSTAIACYYLFTPVPLCFLSP